MINLDENYLMNAIWLFMKRNYKILLVIVAVAAALWSFIPKKNTSNPEKDALLMELITFVIKNGHYSPADINDAFSEKVYNGYLKAIDPNKRFLTLEDIQKMDVYKNQIDDQINGKTFELFDLSYDLIQKRLNNSKAIYTDILSQPFDFDTKEEIDTDFEKAPFAKNDAELKERWRKQLKLSVLSSIEDKIKLQEGKETFDNEEDTDEPNAPVTPTEKKKENKTVEKKSFAELEKEARENSLKSLNDFFDVMKDLTREEWLSIYINSILEQFDPHTNYFSPEIKDKFDESMKGSMEGIGATLRKKNEYTEISEIIVGGPAWRERNLENGDIIMKVAQGNDDPVDIAGMRLDNVVKMIKGKKGTKVRLTVKKVDGTIKEISIIRDKFEIEETFAKSVIISTNNGKFGMIQLPKFYVDFGEKDNRNAFTDVKKEVEFLKDQNVDGILIDLRNNGGGSLQTVVDMVGLFVKQGPVVQVRSPKGQRNVLFDNDKTTLWNGPLLVLINNYSASASEIFAAAIQDYNRGLVVGSKHSYGKGTVQNMFELNNLIKIKDDLGAIKFTSQKFYRINGGSTQLKGVESDIVLPDRFSHIDTGERDSENAMKWDKIEKADYKPLKNDFSKIIENSKKRVASNPEFKLIDENAKWISERKDKNVFSLNYKEFSKENNEIDEKAKKFRVLKDYKNNLKFSSLPNEEALFKNDTVLKKKRDRWHENLTNDVYVEESVKILQEIQKQHKK